MNMQTDLGHRPLDEWVAPRHPNRQAFIEVVLFTALALGISAWAQPQDPFLTRLPFPWLWLVPTVLGLRYGFAAALGSVGLIAGSWLLWSVRDFQVDTDLFPAHYFMGGLILSLIAGEFANVWIIRLKRVREENTYLNERLDSLTRRHYLIKLSHERLEQDMLTKPMTLRDSIMQMRDLMRTTAPEPGQLPHGPSLMALIGQSCQLDVASLYAVHHGDVAAEPSATLGKAQKLYVTDPLVRFALERNELCHVQAEALQDGESRYLAVAPLVATNRQCIGLLVIERMPFLSMNVETLQFLSVLLGYYADHVILLPQAVRILREHPQCPLEFAAELLRLERIFAECGLPSSITALVIADSPMRQDIYAEAQRQRRQLDINWDIRLEDRDILITLMPLYGDAAVTGFLLRTQHWLKELFTADSFVAAGVTPHTTLVNHRSAAELLTGLLDRCLAGTP